MNIKIKYTSDFNPVTWFVNYYIIGDTVHASKRLVKEKDWIQYQYLNMWRYMIKSQITCRHWFLKFYFVRNFRYKILLASNVYSYKRLKQKFYLDRWEQKAFKDLICQKLSKNKNFDRQKVLRILEIKTV